MAEYNVFHRVLKALGLGELPERICVGGRCLRQVRPFKHDFFAATGLYADHVGQAVLKVGRVADVFGLPAAWVGRWLTLREAAFYEELSGLPGIPRYLGLWEEGVGRGRMLGLVHEYVPGHPLGRYERVGDQFFDQLGELLGELHARGMAYVDLNKRENILVGDDGRPYLVDFQISFWSPAGRFGLRRLLQDGDRYHFCKHKRRHRPDLTTPEERARVARRSTWINLHRVLMRPFQRLRRGTLKRIDPEHESERTRLEK